MKDVLTSCVVRTTNRNDNNVNRKYQYMQRCYLYIHNVLAIRPSSVEYIYIYLYNINLDYCHLIGRVRVT